MRLQPLQNRAVRTIKKINGYISTHDMECIHKQLNLKMLSERRKMFMLTLMYKLSLDKENVNTCRPEMLLRTCPKVKMKVPFTDKERVRRSPYYIGSRLWDKLDVQTQTARTMLEFKNMVKKLDLTCL